MLSDTIVEEPSLAEVEAPQVANIPPANLTKPPPIISQPIPSPDSLPAKAIYKKFRRFGNQRGIKRMAGRLHLKKRQKHNWNISITTKNFTSQ